MRPEPTSSRRNRTSRRSAAFLTALLLAAGCGNSEVGTGDQHAGASNGGGGGLAGSGSTSSGGASGSGAAGSANSTGGTSGGSDGDAGASATAGAGAGGISGNGGSTNAGGTSGTGGTGGGASYEPCPTDGSACKIMPFGDSITDGFGTAGGYRVELFRLAHEAGKNITFVGSGSNGPATVGGAPFPPQHEGHSGFTIDTTPSRSGIAPLVSTVMQDFTPHVVTLMIGTNDAIDSYELTEAPDRLGALIDSIFSELPNILLVVGRPIPSQDDALNTRLQAYGAAIPAVVAARAEAGRHILVVDLYEPFAAVSDYKSTLLKDTWHPNEAGHAIIGATWYAALAPSL